MRKWTRRAGIGLLALALTAGIAAAVMREEIARLMAVNSLFEPDRIVENFSHMDRAFLSVALATKPGDPLPDAAPVPLPAGAGDWIADRAVTGIVVLHDGAVTHESYYLGTGPDDLRISWSVAKSALSLLVGTLVADGTLKLDDPVVLHAPELMGSAYDGTSLRDVLQMESGVEFDEDYFDPDSDINRMGRVIALGGALDDFTAELKARDREPGGAWKYVSMDTHVVGMVVRGATGRPVADLLAERILVPAGFGSVTYLTDGEGVHFVLGGLNMTTRDYARLGLLVAQGGVMQGRQIVPLGWIDESTAASANTADGGLGYGYQWWLPADARPGEVMGRGVYGQFLYIDRTRDVVIAVNAADLGFREDGVLEDCVEMFRAIADAQPGAKGA
ncbi:serine hydrolase domain-containing protein [Jannaschia formosa]|uniref:serine hydrolase domain-containing protein n=1 Tax=Jannaschia formosa TaxID=2259592 RepID=UPI000E1BA5BB|nr:serine hydrolase [Jannaschia formosa]TFL18743.1 class C beta-lactamase-related serine hydrolase [Jannaschia formosa]